MNALILNGSPVRNGATAWIAEDAPSSACTTAPERS